MYDCHFMHHTVYDLLLVYVYDFPISSTHYTWIHRNRNALYKTLELLACSFLPLATPNACLSRLLTMPGLRKVEMRQRSPDSTLLEESSEAFLKVVEQAKEKLQESVLYHSDQLRLKDPSIIPIEPGIDKLCPIFSWPYQSNYRQPELMR